MTQNNPNEIFTNKSGNSFVKPKEKAVGQRKSAYGIFIKNNKILAVKPTWTDKWDLPGGKIEIGESTEEGLLREFAEETGYEVLNFKHDPIFQHKQNFYSDDMDEYFYSELSFYLVIEAVKIDTPNIDSEEIKEIQWVEINNLNINNCKDFNIEAIKLAQKTLNL